MRLNAQDRDIKDVPDRPLMIMAMYLAYYRNQFSLPDDVEHVSMANWTTYTYSRGHVHITGSGLTDPVDFDTGWLKDPGDVDVKKHISA